MLSDCYAPPSEFWIKHLDTLLNKQGFVYKSELIRGALYENIEKNIAIMIDYDICNSSCPFSYTEYTKEQNYMMHHYQSIFRFVVDDENDFDRLCDELDHYLHVDDTNDSRIKFNGSHRDLVEIDPTMPEALFE